MDEIDVGMLRQAFPERRIAPGQRQGIPADLRHLERLGSKPPDRALKEAESFLTGALFARFKKKLVAEADPEKRPATVEPLPHRVPKLTLAQIPDTIPKGADPGENDRVHPLEFAPGGNEADFRAFALQRLAD